MAVAFTQQARVNRWRGGQHPTLEKITRQLEEDGLRPYVWVNVPNFRYPTRSHGYNKILYCVEGSLEIVFAEANQRITLRPGDRLEVPRGVRYSATVGPSGVQCAEASAV